MNDIYVKTLIDDFDKLTIQLLYKIKTEVHFLKNNIKNLNARILYILLYNFKKKKNLKKKKKNEQHIVLLIFGG
ncbi:hypothetical protein CW733_11250 [Lacinutrix sp. Bg11-31]|nr:hypothetical protein CW733_11250 [Lacinutrix sp. Bg11-31]